MRLLFIIIYYVEIKVIKYFKCIYFLKSKRKRFSQKVILLLLLNFITILMILIGLHSNLVFYVLSRIKTYKLIYNFICAGFQIYIIFKL